MNFFVVDMPGDIGDYSLQDFVSALQQVRPSVSQSELGLYEDWNRQFGSLALQNPQESGITLVNSSTHHLLHPLLTFKASDVVVQVLALSWRVILKLTQWSLIKCPLKVPSERYKITRETFSRS